MKIKAKGFDYKIKVTQYELDLICALLENTSSGVAEFFGIDITDVWMNLSKYSQHFTTNANINLIKLCDNKE